MMILRNNFGKHGISIEPFIESPGEFVVQDLHVGSTYHVPGDGRSDPFRIDGRYVLNPGTCIVLQTQEKIVANNRLVFGQLTSKGSWIAQGIIIANTKIDPLYGTGSQNAHLKVLIFNGSSLPFVIEPGRPFCSICFFTLEQEVPTEQPKNSPEWPAQPRSGASMFWFNNKVYVITSVATIVAAVLGGFVGAVVQYYLSSK